MKAGVRIIGGQCRGRKIAVPDSKDLRPTPDRIRETLFNWLNQPIRGARCLDMFAGSGILGFEALSRGAREVTLFEQSLKVCQHLKKIAATFPTNAIEIKYGDALALLRQEQNRYQIIFLDPPYHSPLLTEAFQLLTELTILEDEGLVYAESAKPLDFGANWLTLKAKKAGQIYYGLFKRSTV